MTTRPRKNAANTRGRPFQPGNPGKPRGARHKTTLAVEALLAGEAEKLTRAAIDAGLAGDTAALKLCLDRIAPAPKDRTVTFQAPAIKGGDDVPAAMAAVFDAVARGDLTPGEGAALSAIIERYRGAYELQKLEQQIAEMQTKLEDAS